MMNENQPNPANLADLPDLGPMVVSCRRLSGARTLRAQGFLFGWLLYYVLYPLVVLPYLALMTTMLPFLAFGYSVEAMVGPAFAVVFVYFYMVFCWFAYVWPHRNHLVLHEKGLRIRLGFKRLHTLFESIQGVFVGRAPSKVESGLRAVVGLLKPGQADWLNQVNTTAITVVLNDGSARIFKGILTCFEPADLERLFHELVERNPRLGDDRTIRSASAEQGAPTDGGRDRGSS